MLNINISFSSTPVHLFGSIVSLDSSRSSTVGLKSMITVVRPFVLVSTPVKTEASESRIVRGVAGSMDRHVFLSIQGIQCLFHLSNNRVLWQSLTIAV